MSKYMRKTPVDAIQWNGHNAQEVYEFINNAANACCVPDNKSGSLVVAGKDHRGRKFKTIIPKFGWVVIEGKTLQFYKDETFRKTFKAAEEDSKGIDWDGMTDTINKAFEGFDDMFKGFHGISKEKIQDVVNNEARGANIRNIAQPFADFLQRGWISREEAEKHLLGGVTFDSVLDEMKELHSKKNKDYGDAFHKSFVEFGPTAGIVRLNDKMERAKSLVKNGKAEVKDESLMDTLKDMSSYAVMLYVELKNQSNGRH